MTELTLSPASTALILRYQGIEPGNKTAEKTS